MVAEKGRAANTVAAYRRDLTGYCVWLEHRGVTPLDVDHAQLVEFVGQRRQSGAATSSIARQLAAVRMLHRYLSIEGERRDDPAAELAGVRVPSGIPKPLSEAQVTSLIDAVVITEPIHRRDLALIELLYATGARISEAVGLSIGEIDIEARLVRLYGKGSKERIVPFGSSAAAALDDWFSASGRARLVPDQWRTRGDAEAVFLNRRGGRLTRQAAWLRDQEVRRPRRHRGRPVATRAPAFVCDPPPRSRRGSACGPGDARSCLDLDHADLHQGQPGATVGCVSLGPSTRHTGVVTRSPILSTWHLAARFVTSLPATPPTVDDEVWVDDHLLAGRAPAVGATVQPGSSTQCRRGTPIRRSPSGCDACRDRRRAPPRHRQDRVRSGHLGPSRRDAGRTSHASIPCVPRS